MIDRAAIEQEIRLWADLYGWIPSDAAAPLEKVLLDDAIKEAEKHLTTDMDDPTYAVIMALLVKQQELIAYWGKEWLKVKRPFPDMIASIEINTSEQGESS